MFGEASLVASALALGMSTLMMILGWSLSRNVRNNDDQIVDLRAAVLNANKEIEKVKIALETVAKSDDLSKMATSVGKMEVQLNFVVQELSKLTDRKTRSR